MQKYISKDPNGGGTRFRILQRARRSAESLLDDHIEQLEVIRRVFAATGHNEM